jgi:hypothetical protein
MSVRAGVPEEFGGRGIPPPTEARGFRLSLDVAEPWRGGTIDGRVESIPGRRSDPRSLTVSISCIAAWVDIAPQLVGRGRLGLSSAYELRARARPIWLDEMIYRDEVEVGPLDGSANWRRFEFTLPDFVPRAFEGTLCAFRYTVEAARPRVVGRSLSALPLILVGERREPVMRIETTPIGTWRLFEWRADGECDAEAGPVSVRFEPRAEADMPQAGETRDDEILRRTGRVASAG